MQQRRLRLGDIVDDYCPRERRITNHAIVAMIEDQVKQTRCTTCDADHEYKQARIPAQRRKKDTAAGLSPDGAASPRKRPAADTADAVVEAAASHAPESPESHQSPEEETVPFSTTEPEAGAPLQASEPAASDAAAVQTSAVHASAAHASAQQASAEEPLSAGDTADEPASLDDDGPVHRRLIRATLPRPEGQPPERKMPEFTMHQREANGNRAGRHRRGPRPGQTRAQYGNGQPSRFGGQRPGPRHGSGPGSGGQAGGQGQPGQPRRRKRRR